jgi:hypothetical protein
MLPNKKRRFKKISVTEYSTRFEWKKLSRITWSMGKMRSIA